MNHSHVTRAEGYLDAVLVARDNLKELHDRLDGKPYNDRQSRNIAAQYDAIRTGTRLAEAHAAIAQAQALERIAQALETRVPGMPLPVIR